MLTDADRELITAAVDGALDDRIEPQFRALIAESADAAALYSQLQGHARRLRELRRVPAPSGLAGVVVARVRSGPPTVAPSRRRAAAARAGWAAFVVAASLFLAVVAGSYWYVQRTGSDRTPVAHLIPHSPATPPNGDTILRVPDHEPIEVAAAPRAAGSDEALAVIPPEVHSETAPLPRPVSDDVIGSPLLAKSTAFKTVDVRIPLRATVADLDQQAWKARVAAELAHDPAYRLDLFVHDTLRAAEVFQASAAAAGVNLTVDSIAQDRLRKNLPTTWVVYTEALTPDEAAGLLARLAAHSRDADPTPVFASAHLFPAQATDAHDVRDLLGADLGVLKRPRVAGPKSVAAGTADAVTAALLKGERAAIFLSHLSFNGRLLPGAPKDVKAYLGTRGERKPATIPLLIVIRPVS